MEKIKIITDSTADLSKEICEKYDIEVLPLLINFGENSYLDGVEINTNEVFEKIENEKWSRLRISAQRGSSNPRRELIDRIEQEDFCHLQRAFMHRCISYRQSG